MTSLSEIRPEVKELLALADELELTDQQREFAIQLATDPERNQTKAAIAIGVKPDQAAARGSHWAAMSKVARYIQALTAVATKSLEKRTGRSIMEMTEMLEDLTEEAKASVDDFIDINDDGTWQWNLKKAKDSGKLHLIESLDHDKETGAPIIRLQSKRVARQEIAKLKGYYPQKDASVVVGGTHNHLTVVGDAGIDALKKLREAMAQAKESE